MEISEKYIVAFCSMFIYNKLLHEYFLMRLVLCLNKWQSTDVRKEHEVWKHILPATLVVDI